MQDDSILHFGQSAVFPFLESSSVHSIIFLI